MKTSDFCLDITETGKLLPLAQCILSTITPHSVQWWFQLQYVWSIFFYKTRDTQENTCSWKTGHKANWPHILIPWIFPFFYLQKSLSCVKILCWFLVLLFCRVIGYWSLFWFLPYCRILDAFLLACLHCVLTWSWPPSPLSVLLYHTTLSQVKASVTYSSYLLF